jgi:hypothetical protein
MTERAGRPYRWPSAKRTEGGGGVVVSNMISTSYCNLDYLYSNESLHPGHFAMNQHLDSFQMPSKEIVCNTLPCFTKVDLDIFARTFHSLMTWAVCHSLFFVLRCPSSNLPVDDTRWRFAGSPGAVFNSPVDYTRWHFADSSGAVFDSSHQAMRKSEHSNEHLWIDVACASLLSLSGFALIVAAMNVSLHP